MKAKLDQALAEARQLLIEDLMRTNDENRQDIQAMETTIDTLTKSNLENSILYEGARKANRELKQENESLHGIIGIMKENAELYLEMFEQIFKSDEAAFKYEDMDKYIRVAGYFLIRYDRTSNLIDQVSARMTQLPSK